MEHAITMADLDDCLEGLLREAKEASHKRRSEDALKYYNEVIGWNPRHQAAWWGKSCELFQLRVRARTNEYLREEIESYEMNLSLSNEADQYFTWYMRAEAHEELGQIELAILSYTRFIELCSEEDEDDLASGARRRILQLVQEL